MNVSGYESNSWLPTSVQIEKMADILNFPLGWFYAPDIDLIDVEAPSFRSRRSMTASLRNQATRNGGLATDVISVEMRSRFALPAVDVPNLSGQSPEVAAAEMRSHWKLGQGPIPNMVHLLESRGIEAYWINIGSSSVDAWSLWRNDRPFVILDIFKNAGDRSRFDAAHELGHLVLHRRETRLDGRKAEDEADRFASSFLMPKEQFQAESPQFPIMTQYFALKKRWGVSLAALIRRSRDVGKLTPWQYECACKELSVRGWRKQEPSEIALPLEQSRIHALVFEKMAKKGITPQQFALSINLSVDDVFTLMPLSRQYDPNRKPDIKLRHLKMV